MFRNGTTFALLLIDRLDNFKQGITMVLYKKKNVPITRFFFAIIVFTLGLTLAFDDVYGLQLPFGQQATDSYNDYLDKTVETSDDDARALDINNIQQDNHDTQPGETDTVPTSVPEPSTIILLASGLGLFRLANRKKS